MVYKSKVDFDGREVQILREDSCQGLRVLTRSPQPLANRLIQMAGNLFCRPQTSSAHHHQQRLGRLFEKLQNRL